MDIVFHYFAVKTIALEAGFEEDDAQQIAKYSQFVDDNNSFKYRTLNNIPQDIKDGDLGYDLYRSSSLPFGEFDPATTGFSDNTDLVHLELEKSQKFIVSPFHFVPFNKSHMDKNDFKTHEATLEDDSFISNQLNLAKTEFNAAKDSVTKKRALMRIGMLLHVFADTYAHALFSGYQDDCNNFDIELVTNNVTDMDVSKKYKDAVYKIAKLAKIGHGGVGHLPDLTFISYKMKKYGIFYERNNSSCFIKAGVEIFKYLKSLKGIDIVNIDEINNITGKLNRGFMFEYNDPENKDEFDKIKAHWKNLTNYNYSYDKNEFNEIFFPEYSYITSYPASEEYYAFNRYANKFLIDLYGKPQPRRD